jgi:hypothetical protein
MLGVSFFIVMLSVIMLSGVMLNVVMLSVVPPVNACEQNTQQLIARKCKLQEEKFYNIALTFLTL